jgi:tRNA(Ile)-lysidine synthase
LAPNARARPAANNAVGPAAFEAALAALGVAPPFAVAVSGGADSLAVLRLTAAWCKKRTLAPPLALTVDHGLRAESAGEAAQVASWARAIGVPHETLTWVGAKPERNIQAAAREARYRLLGERLRSKGIAILLTGHTQDDQAETFLLRLARGSGLEGLSGMAPVAPFPLPEFTTLQIARPLLPFTHAALTETLVQLKQSWINDPSNANDRFARVQVRNARKGLEAAGLTADRIAATTLHLRRAQEAIDEAVAALIAAAADATPWGYAMLATDQFATAPREVALRALAKLLKVYGGAAFPPRFEQTEALLDWLTVPRAKPTGRTLGGVRLARRTTTTVMLTREEAALSREDPSVPIEPGTSQLWDRRFLITVPRSVRAPVEAAKLGVAGLKAAGANAALPPVEPRRIAAALPALWRNGCLVAAPLIRYAGDESAISARFVGFAGT